MEPHHVLMDTSVPLTSGSQLAVGLLPGLLIFGLDIILVRWSMGLPPQTRTGGFAGRPEETRRGTLRFCNGQNLIFNLIGGRTMSLDLIEVTAANVDIHRMLYRWDHEENHREQFTCRPIPALPDWDAFMESIVHRLHSDALRIFVLWDATMKALLGRVTTFDYNSRNRSAEFGYYLPPVHRQHGYGREMVHRFLAKMFADRIWPLHKLYATTASGNIPSIRLLEGLGFHLDGVMREHYWFETEVQDQLCYSLLAREWKLR